jgi:hypothetical protein
MTFLAIGLFNAAGNEPDCTFIMEAKGSPNRHRQVMSIVTSIKISWLNCKISVWFSDTTSRIDSSIRRGARRRRSRIFMSNGTVGAHQKKGDQDDDKHDPANASDHEHVPAMSAKSRYALRRSTEVKSTAIYTSCKPR